MSPDGNYNLYFSRTLSGSFDESLSHLGTKISKHTDPRMMINGKLLLSLFDPQTHISYY